MEEGAGVSDGCGHGVRHHRLRWGGVSGMRKVLADDPAPVDMVGDFNDDSREIRVSAESTTSGLERADGSIV